MAQYLIQDTTLQNIANAIRSKNNSSAAMTPDQMTTAIQALSIGNSGSSTSNNFASIQAHVDAHTTGAFVTLISNNEFIRNNYNNSNLFVIITPNNIDAIDGSAYSSTYCWTCMFAGNKNISTSTENIWYGMGIYMMLGKGYSYPSTLEISCSLNDTSSTNRSYINANSNGDIRVYICGYDVIASGDYTVTFGLLA